MKRIAQFILLSFISISVATGQKQPNFLLITIDTWRADYISASGSRRVQTPFLDRLAREGSYIKYADAPTPLTTPSHASILTGLYPVNHSIRDNSHFRLRDDVKTMAQLFRGKGYGTIGVVSGAPLRSIYGLNRGFDIYDDAGIGSEGDNALVPASRAARESSLVALEWAKKARATNIFLWLHLYDPHYPYTPPQEYRNKYPKDYYAGEVAYIDKVLGDFVNRLMVGRRGSWVIAVTGDHGEGLGDRGEMTHGILLYRQTREVPLILWDSEKRARGFGPGAKGLVDILPAISDLFSLDRPNCDGISLFSDTTSTRWLFSESFSPVTNYGLNPAILARKGEEIYIRHGTSLEVYQGGDEEANLYAARRGFAASAEAEIKKRSLGGRVPSSSLKLGGEEIETLASLGYITSSSPATQMAIPCDLRDFCKDQSNLFGRGQEELKNGNLEKARSLYEMMVKKYPDSPMLRLFNGNLLVNMKKFGEAKHEFKTCLKLDPRNSDAMNNLGNIMLLEGRLEEAEKFYRSSLSCEEDKADAHYNLGMLYARDPGRRSMAISHLRRFIELSPKSPQRKNAENLLRSLDTTD